MTDDEVVAAVRRAARGRELTLAERRDRVLWHLLLRLYTALSNGGLAPNSASSASAATRPTKTTRSTWPNCTSPTPKGRILAGVVPVYA